MKKTLIALLTLLMVGLMGFATLGSISFCTETDGSDAWCFGDTDYLYFGTDRDAKIAWVTDSCVFTTDLDIVGAVDITGALTFSGALAVTGNFTADGTVMSVDGSTSVDLISAGHVDTEAPNIRLGLNATEYMNLATTVTSGNLAITHPGKTPAVTWTATSFDFGGTFAADAVTVSDVLTFSDGGTIDNSSGTVLQLTETTIDLAGATLADALTLSDVLTFSGAGTIDNTTADILALVETTVAVTGILDVTGNFTQDGTAVSIDGDTTCDLLGATRIDIESPLIYLGRDVDDYMLLTTTDTSGNLAITHEGTPAVTWTAASFDFIGTFAADAVTVSDVLTFSDAATIDNSNATTLQLTEDNIDLVGACAADALTLSDVLTFSGAGTIDNTTADILMLTEATVAVTGIFDVTGNFTQDGTAVSIDGDTTCDLLGATRIDIESPLIYLGRDVDDYMLFTTTDTSGNLAITHEGTPAVTWTAASFDFIGTFAADAVTVSDVLTFSDAGTIDNSAADTLQLSETYIDLVGGTLADTLSLSDVLTFSDDATIDNSNATTLALTETTIDLVGATLADALTLSDVLTFSDAATIDNSNATTLTLTEDTIDLVGAAVADDLTLSDVLTFSDGGTMDNTAADTITITEDNIVLTGASGVTVTDTGPFTVGPDPVVLSHRHRVTVGELIAGPHEMMPAVAGRTYRVVDVTVIAYGGAVGTTTTVDILGDQAGSVKLFTYAQANLTQGTILNTDSAGVVVLADGASFVPCTANTAITASFTGGNPDTATGVDFIITYVLE